MKTVNTTCKVCSKPLQIQIEDNLPYGFRKSMDTLAQMATCNECVDRRYPHEKEEQPPQPPQPSENRNLPYVD